MMISNNLTVRVINLDTDIARRKAVEENLKDFNGGNWSFFKALRSDAPFKYISDTTKQLIHYGRELGSGEIGCFKSHVSVIEDFVSMQDTNWLLVLEDDVWVDVQFNFQDTIAIAEKADINYIRLYAKRLKPAELVYTWGERELIRYATDPYGTQAYLINKAGARRFLDSLKVISLPIDDEMSRFWINGLEIFAISPFPVIEKSAPSNLTGERAHRMSKLNPKAINRFLFKVSEKVAKDFANLNFYLRRRSVPKQISNA